MLKASSRSRYLSVRSTSPSVAGEGIALRFVTISRQVGVGYECLPQRLVQALNAPGTLLGQGWSAWNRELIDKVAADNGISVAAIDRVEQFGYSWLDTFVSGLGGMPDDFAIMHRMRDSVRALATAGRVVLVGHGSVFMTRDLPGGIHIRLVAPLTQRIENFQRLLNTTRSEATERLQQAQRRWAAFLRRFWPTHSLAPETFAATLNTAVVDEDSTIKCIISLSEQSSGTAPKTPPRPC